MRLLVSVTSAEEARTAIAGGADIIDVKNPAEGALGAASVAALRDVCAVLEPANRLASAALGDSDTTPGALALAAYGAANFNIHYLKLGLARIGPDEAIKIINIVQENAHIANPDCELIAVGFADGVELQALPWQLLPEIAHAARIRGCMIDTALKDGRRLFDHCDETALASWIAECREAGLLCALAGSLQATDLPALRRLDPDVVGFRGAACSGDRVKGRIDLELVRALRTGLAV